MIWGDPRKDQIVQQIVTTLCDVTEGTGDKTFDCDRWKGPTKCQPWQKAKIPAFFGLQGGCKQRAHCAVLVKTACSFSLAYLAWWRRRSPVSWWWKRPAWTGPCTPSAAARCRRGGAAAPPPGLKTNGAMQKFREFFQKPNVKCIKKKRWKGILQLKVKVWGFFFSFDYKKYMIKKLLLSAFYICIHIYVDIHTHTYILACKENTSVDRYIFIYFCTCVYTCKICIYSTDMYIFIHISIFMFFFLYMHMHIYIFFHLIPLCRNSF